MTRILNENEINQAEVVLAVKSVVDMLQDMAEKTAKVEADDIMPILDSVQAYFGENVSEQLSTTASEALKQVLDALKSAKSSLGAVASQMENAVTGEGGTNDMGNNVGVPDDMGGDAETPEIPGKTVGVGKAAVADVDDVFADSPAPTAPVARAAKESIAYDTKAIKQLRESADPDRLILNNTLRLIKENKTAKQAVIETALKYNVDVKDILDIIKEAKAKK